MIKNIEFLRGLFCLAILLCHAFAGANSQLSHIVVKHFLSGGFAVDFFFVISGFFLYYEVTKSRLEGFNIPVFIGKKVARLIPVFIFVSLVAAVYLCLGLVSDGQAFHFRDFLMGCLFIKNIGVYNDSLNFDFFYNNSHTWFISPLFWTLVFYYVMFALFEEKRVLFAMGIMMFVCYSFRATETMVPNVMMYSTVVRSIPNIALGYFIGLLASKQCVRGGGRDSK